MYDTNGHDPGLVDDAKQTTFDVLAEQIEGLYEIVAAKRDLLRAELAAVDAEARQLERMLNIARPPEAAPAKPQSKSQAGRHRSRVSDANKDRIVAFLATHDPAPKRGFQRDDIALALRMSKSTIGYALTELREDERIRLVGKDTTPGLMGQRPNLYAVMPNG